MNRLCRGGGGRKRRGNGEEEKTRRPKEKREDASRMLRNELGREQRGEMKW